MFRDTDIAQPAGHRGSIARQLHPVQRIAIHALLIALCIPFALPLVWMVSTSFMEDSQVFGGGAAGPIRNLVPHRLRWENYVDAATAVPIGKPLRNTLYLCTMNVVGAVLSSAVVAYGFARMRFRGRDFLFVLMIGTLALPGQVTMIPVFALFRSLGWYGTYLPLIVPAFFGSAFYIFLLRQFFQTIPEELTEAARIDGAGEWRIFWQIMLPLAKPALATCALFEFMTTWNDYLGPLLYINDPQHYTLAYGIEQFKSSYGGRWAQLMAGATMFTLPVVALFFLAQRTFIQGIATTGGRS
ncbi:MAG: carbohydrate ABC transporter permease [Candidatus Hydrogenedentes bacterium]|nr:carbohydrate ABC transporter permease [Candidatus Hydrogenedentota bacterium]